MKLNEWHGSLTWACILTAPVSWPPLYSSSLSLSASKPHYVAVCPPHVTHVHALSAVDALSPATKTKLSAITRTYTTLTGFRTLPPASIFGYFVEVT
jgi:hypothetical protein